MRELTALQEILKAAYKDAFQKRNDAVRRVNVTLFRLQESRAGRGNAQRWLEKVGTELKASGFPNADDYLERVWPIAGPPEEAWDDDILAVCE